MEEEHPPPFQSLSPFLIQVANSHWINSGFIKSLLNLTKLEKAAQNYQIKPNNPG